MADKFLTSPVKALAFLQLNNLFKDLKGICHYLYTLLLWPHYLA